MKKYFFAIFGFLVFSLNIAAQNQTEYSWRYYRPGNTGIQGDQPTVLWIDENNDPYFASYTPGWDEGGFVKFDQQNNNWINYSNVDYPVIGDFYGTEIYIYEIIQDVEKNLWMGTNYGALRFAPSVGTSSIERITPSNSQLHGNTYDMDVAPDSSIWFVSDGLVQYKPEDDTWNYWPEANLRLAIQPKPDGNYIVWSADTYYGYVFSYNTSSNQLTNYLPDSLGQIAGLPGKDCVDDAGNLWALRMAENGDWETLEYQTPNGDWVYPTPPYTNVSFYIDAFKAFGNGKAVMALTTGEVWYFNGTFWNNYGTWRPGDFNFSVDMDKQGNVWVCGIGGAAKRNAVTGDWQRYRITNTSQIDYFVEDFSFDNDGNVWFTGNAGTGIGGIQKFDGERWTGFNQYTYGLGYDFPYQADNTQAIISRPSNNDVVFNPTFQGIFGWNGTSYFALEDSMNASKGFVEDSQNRLWSLGEYYNVRYYDENIFDWITIPFVGWGEIIRKDPELDGTIWALSADEILRTNGVDNFTLHPQDFPDVNGFFSGIVFDKNDVLWIGAGNALINYNSTTGSYTTIKPDSLWPFPGDFIRPMIVTPDGKLWLVYDSEFPNLVAGLCWYDGNEVGVLPSSPGGVPQWGGLPNSNIKDLKYREVTNGYELWMSCKGRGIAVLTVKQNPTSIDEAENIPSDFMLSQNYPNPFNPSTKIKWQSPVSGHQTLKIYDVLGNEVATLVDEFRDAGSYEITYNASKFSSGTYFYKLQAGDFIHTRKMVLLK